MAQAEEDEPKYKPKNAIGDMVTATMIMGGAGPYALSCSNHTHKAKCWSLGLSLLGREGLLAYLVRSNYSECAGVDV